MYIIGLPTDTKDTFKKTLDYAKKINSMYAQFSVFTPYPGTPAFENYEKKINVKKYENFTQWELVFDHPNFNNSEIRQILENSYKEYYLRTKWIFKFIKKKFYEL